MKILFVADAYYPSKGGVQNVTKYLAEGLAKENEVLVITLGKEKKDKVINNVKIKNFNIQKNKLKKYFGEIEEYKKYIKNTDADYIIFECCETITFNLILPIMKNIKSKKILHAHGCYGRTLKPFVFKENFIKTLGNTYNYIYYKFYYYPIFLKKYINEIDGIISLHKEDSGTTYFNKNFQGKKFVLGNAADKDFFNMDNSKECFFNENINKKYFVSDAYYRNIKNQIGILKQFNKSKAKDKYKLIFIGEKETEYYQELIKVIKKLKLEKNVIALTNVERKFIPSIISNSYLYLIGSTYEEFSISLIEAMATGVPFISTNVGNAKQLPGGITLSNINQMHYNIDKLVNEKSQYYKLSEQGKKFAIENCTVDKCVKKLKNIILEV